MKLNKAFAFSLTALAVAWAGTAMAADYPTRAI